MIIFVIASSFGSVLFCLLTWAYYKRFATAPIVVSLILSIIIGYFYSSYNVALFLVYYVLLLLFWMLALEDIESLSIGDWQLAAFAVAVVIARIFLRIPFLLNAVSVAVAAALFFIPYWLSRGKGIGIGDGMVFAIFALLLTPVETVVVFLMTTLTATLFAASVFAVKRKLEPFPLLPFAFYSALAFLPAKSFWIALFGLQTVYTLQWIK